MQTITSVFDADGINHEVSVKNTKLKKMVKVVLSIEVAFTLALIPYLIPLVCDLFVKH